MDGGWLRCELFGRTRDERTARTIVLGQGDPADRITVACVCESALALACGAEKLPVRAGVSTPASGLGETLPARLRSHVLTIAGTQ